MDVNLISTKPYPLPRSNEIAENTADLSAPVKKTAMPSAFGEKETEGDKIREEVMMNLEQVQNFLYMLIGSKLRIEHGHKFPGSSVNTAV